MRRKQFLICTILFCVFFFAFLIKVEKDNTEWKKVQRGKGGGEYYAVHLVEVTEEPEPTNTPEVNEIEFVDYQKAFYYKIPSQYEDADLSEKLQEYLFEECKDREIKYSIALALIERESGYYSKCSGDNGNSKGYMQVYEKYHKEVMEAEGVTNLYDAKGNIRVGLHILQEIYDKYGDSGDHCVLMVYNMGSYKANKLWEKKIYSTRYSRYIMNRAEQIEQDLEQDKTGD